MRKTLSAFQIVQKPHKSVLISQASQKIGWVQKILMCVTVCHSLSGLAALPVEWTGKNRIFTAVKNNSFCCHQYHHYHKVTIQFNLALISCGTCHFQSVYEMALPVKCFVETVACNPLNDQFWAVRSFCTVYIYWTIRWFCLLQIVLTLWLKPNGVWPCKWKLVSITSIWCCLF